MPYFALPPEPPAIALYASEPITGLDGEPTPGSVYNRLLAQAVVPAADGTGTLVMPQGNQFDITGGQRSNNGANLFHSFRQFGLSTGQIANFLSDPGILNILTRITGGDPSIINGRLQVTGSNANLFLINPAGIIFGPNASLNIAGAFTATTANAIGFGQPAWGNGQWLNVVGDNNYTTLTSTPNTFAFTLPNPGAIINAGNLAVGQGQGLTLLGGTVINTGNLTAPGGQITIAAVPGENLVRLSQPNSLLSLELAPISPIAPALTPVTPPSLPALLTGGNLGNATGLALNPDGTVQLLGSNVTISAVPGTTIVGGQVSVASPAGAIANAAQPLPQITVLGDRVGLIGANLNASGPQGGTVRIGGDYQGQRTLPTATHTYVDRTATIQADGISALDGSLVAPANGGRVIVWSDQITGFYGTISARGGQSAGNGGFVEVSGKGNLAFQGGVNVTAANGRIGTVLLDPTNITIVAAGANDNQLNPNVPTAGDPAGQILAGDGGAVDFTLSAAVLSSQLGNVVLEATNNIAIAAGLSLNFAAGGGSITFRADADNNGAGAFTMDPTQTINTNGRNLTISGASLTLGNITTGSPPAGTSVSGIVNLTASTNVTVGNISTLAAGVTAATAGNVAINAGSITTGDINASAFTAGGGTSATGGSVNLTTSNGNLVFRSINTSGSVATNSQGGNVALSANGVIQGTGTGNTITTASATQSGNIAIQHNGGATNLPFTVGATSGNGTTGAINAGGASIITTGTFPIQPPTGGSVVVGTAPNAITLTGVNQPPTLTLNQTIAGGTINQPLQFTYAELAPILGDPDIPTDVTTLVVTAINLGTLTVNGVIATLGTVISPGDVLVYTPPPNTSGLISSAFSLAATDGVAFSAPASGQININVSPLPVTPPDDDTITNVLESPPAQIINPVNNLVLSSLPCVSTDIGVASLDNQYSQEYQEYLGKRTGAGRGRFLEACDVFSQIESATGVKPALVYVGFVPTTLQSPTAAPKSLESAASIAQLQITQPSVVSDSDQLEIVAVIPNRPPIYRRVSGATRDAVLKTVRQFTNVITDPISRETNEYLAPAQQLYQWFVQPLEAELQKRQVDNLVFIMDVGLRSLPLAALHDGKGFLIERFSLGLMPSLSLTDTRYQDIKAAEVLAMGASRFEDQKPLPAVPLELETIFKTGWTGKFFLNEAFTLNNLKSQRQQTPYGIIHLATHAEFRPGSPDQSYIQLWDTKLRLDQVRQLGWDSPPVQLLVLSACRTALGDTEAELGFAGLAYQTGVRSALASLWAVDDEGTLAFMTEFYQRLRTAPIKAEALRQAQLAMIRKQVRLEGGQLITPSGNIPLPSELNQSGNKDLTFPFYWAAFTLVGNPW